MAKLLASRTAQYPLSADFNFSFGDTAIDAVNLAVKTFGANAADNIVFDAIPLPPGAVVVGGDLIVEIPGVGPAPYTVTVGSATNASDLLAATDLTVAGRTALTGLGLSHNGGGNIRIAVTTSGGGATAGKFRLRVQYVIDRRTSEIQIT